MPATKEKLTKQQNQLLGFLREGPLTSAQLADLAWAKAEAGRRNMPKPSIGQINSAMRRIEDRELVRRLDQNKPMKWELTRKGRNAVS